ncbi:hypothetical protein L3X38_004579 [Prunus dulcis]|uniref:Uncharacterized protein n=1 Tax=Prunus dulcis TaxID=3755 RepID=A0AAD4ZP87_PRUDU|nr:hypothetical protein L3X38_004579 [Prunus dulcis]
MELVPSWPEMGGCRWWWLAGDGWRRLSAFLEIGQKGVDRWWLAGGGCRWRWLAGDGWRQLLAFVAAGQKGVGMWWLAGGGGGGSWPVVVATNQKGDCRGGHVA